MENENMTEDVRQASSFAMEDIREQFPETIEKLEDIGGDIIDHWYQVADFYYLTA